MNSLEAMQTQRPSVAEMLLRDAAERTYNNRRYDTTIDRMHEPES